MNAQRSKSSAYFVMAFHEIENLMTRMFRTLLKDQALSYFEHHLMRRLEEEDSEVPENEHIELVLQDVSLESSLNAPYACKSII
jgi:hypothetical protein